MQVFSSHPPPTVTHVEIQSEFTDQDIISESDSDSEEKKEESTTNDLSSRQKTQITLTKLRKDNENVFGSSHSLSAAEDLSPQPRYHGGINSSAGTERPLSVSMKKSRFLRKTTPDTSSAADNGTNSSNSSSCLSLFKFCHARRVNAGDHLCPENSQNDIFPSYVEINQQIGTGTFSTVYLAVHKPTGIEFALKKLNNKASSGTEFEVHKNLDHPFIAAFYGSIGDNLLMMEYVHGDSLLTKVNQANGFSENFTLKIFCQLLSAIHYLHKFVHLVHRDLKLENVILDDYGNVRLIDFGMSKMNKEVMSTMCGSMAYAAPEILAHQPYSPKVDFWSLGVILYAMVYAKLPFTSGNANDLIKIIKTNEPDFKKVQNQCSEKCQDLIKNLLSKDPNSRPDFKFIKNHPWIKNCPYSSILKKNFMIDPTLKIFPFASPSSPSSPSSPASPPTLNYFSTITKPNFASTQKIQLRPSFASTSNLASNEEAPSSTRSSLRARTNLYATQKIQSVTNLSSFMQTSKSSGNSTKASILSNEETDDDSINMKQVKCDVFTLTKLEELGFDVNEVEKAVVKRLDNELTMAYRIYRHNSIKQDLDEARSMNKSSTSGKLKPSLSDNISMKRMGQDLSLPIVHLNQPPQPPPQQQQQQQQQKQHVQQKRSQPPLQSLNINENGVTGVVAKTSPEGQKSSRVTLNQILPKPRLSLNQIRNSHMRQYSMEKCTLGQIVSDMNVNVKFRRTESDLE